MMEKPPVGTLPHCGVQRHEVDERFQLLDLRLERGKRPVKRGTKVLRTVLARHRPVHGR